jgi:hypothetical protein
MCAIQDIMHVLKRIRNNIESSKLENQTKPGRYLFFNNHPIVWDKIDVCSKREIAEESRSGS